MRFYKYLFLGLKGKLSSSLLRTSLGCFVVLYFLFGTGFTATFFSYLNAEVLSVQDTDGYQGKQQLLPYALHVTEEDVVSKGRKTSIFPQKKQPSFGFKDLQNEIISREAYTQKDEMREVKTYVNAGPDVDFTIDDNTPCAGAMVQFTSTVNGNTPFTYAWDFGDGNTSDLESPTHSFQTNGNDPQVYSVTLVVTDVMNLSTTVSKEVSVGKGPDIGFFSGTNSFVNCSTNSTDTDFNLELYLDSSSSSDDITSYTIDWGDGKPNETFSSFPDTGFVTHTYAIGIFSLVVSATNANGCTNEVSYDISNGSNPGGAFESSGSTTGLCFPTEALTFKIGGLWGLNPINTTYVVDFGDGNSESFTQQDLEGSAYYNSTDPSASTGFEVYHSYTRGSCSEENGEFIASLTITNDCGDTQWTIDSINILEPSKPLFELPSEIGCVNVPIQFNNQSIIGTNGDCDKSARFMWDFGDGSPVVNTPPGSAAVDRSHTYTEPGNYTIKLSVYGTCGTETYEQQICIEPEILASFEVDTLAGCAPLSVSAQNTIDESELCSDPSYNWTVDYIAANCETSGDWEFTNGTDANSENPQFNFKNPGKYKLTQYIITNCETTPVEKIIEVKKPPEASIEVIDNFCGTALMNPVGSVKQCTENTSEVSYNWTFVGGVPATSNAKEPGDIAYDTPGVYEVTLQVSNSCGDSNITKQTFEVFEKPVVTNTAVTQEICSGQSTSEIELAASMSSTSFTWTATASDGISGFLSSGEGTTIPSELLMSTRNTPGTLVYAVTPKTEQCDGIVKEFTVTVNPTPLFTSQPDGSEVCLNGTPNTLEVTFTNGTGTASYQWYVNTTDSNIRGDLITGATANSYDPPASVVGDFFYYAVISFDAGGCNEISSETAKVRVQPQLSIDTDPSSQLICVGGSVSPLNVSYEGGAGTPSYQWYANTTNSNTGGTSIAGATNASYTPTGFDNAGDFYYYVTIALDGDGCNTITSDAYTVSVVLKPSIATQPLASQELCQGVGATELTVVAAGGIGTSYSYQWFKNTSNSVSGGTVINGATASAYNPNTTNVGTFYYYVVVFQDAFACSVVSSVSELKVKQAPVFTTQPENSEVCLNGTPTTLEVAYANGTGVPSYQWYVNTIDSTTGAVPIDGATESSYIPVADALGDLFYYVVMSFDTGGCNEIYSQTAKVRVQPQLTIDSSASNQTICVGGEVDSLEVSYQGGTGSPSYQWYANTTNSNLGGVSIAGATNSSYTPTNFNSVGELYYYVTIASNGVGCSTNTSDVYTVKVTAPPSIFSQPMTSQELCQGSVAMNLSVSATGGTSASYAYQWFQNSSNSAVNGDAITGATEASFTPNTDTVGTFYYYAIVSQSESACDAVSSVSELKVKQVPVFTLQPESSEVCLNGNAATLEVAYANGIGVPNYQWYVNTIDSATGGNPIVGATSSSYNPNADGLGDLFYYAIISFSFGGCAEIISETARVRVSQTPVITSASITTYSGVTFSFDPSSVTGNIVPNNTTYTWSEPTISPINSIVGASSEVIPQSNISQTLENVGVETAVAVYVIIPETPNCIGNSFELEVLVNASINPNTVVKDNSCFQANDGQITTAIQGGVPFEIGAPYLISWTGPNGFVSDAPNLYNLAAGEYEVMIEDKEGFIFKESYTIAEPLLLTIDTIVKKDITCFQANDGVIEVDVQGGTFPYTYNWTTSDGSGLIAGEKNQSSLTAGSYALEVIDKNNCVTSTEYIIAEPDALIIQIANKQNVLCFGYATGSIDVEVTGGNANYTYRWTGPNTFTSNFQDLSSLISGNYELTVTDELGCSKTASVMIEQPSEVRVAVTKTDVSCYGEADGSIALAVSGGVAPYTISWSNFANGFSQNNLTAGTYTATITDANACVVTTEISIERPDFFIETEVTPISCNDGSDGAIHLKLTGGIAPIVVKWSDNATAGLQRNNLPAGTYTVVVQDSGSLQCPIEETFTLVNPPKFTVSSVVTEAIECDIANSGVIDLTVAGGTAPYTFAWSNGAISEDLENIGEGDYAVEITDANGCTLNKQFSVFRQEPLEITFQEETRTNCDLNTVSKRVVPSVSGGFLPYTYQWSAGTLSGVNNEILTTNQKGSYELTITDNKGCTVRKSYEVEEMPEIGTVSYEYSSFSLANFDLLSIKDPIEFTNFSTGDYVSLTWDFGDGTIIENEQSPIHTYDQAGSFTVRLSAKYLDDCVKTFERLLVVTKGYIVMIPTGFTPNGDGYNETIRPSFKGFKSIEMSIYDTWGSLVYFEEGLRLEGWNGINGKYPAQNGSYVLVVKGITFYDKEVVNSSPITLLK